MRALNKLDKCIQRTIYSSREVCDLQAIYSISDYLQPNYANLLPTIDGSINNNIVQYSKNLINHITYCESPSEHHNIAFNPTTMRYHQICEPSEVAQFGLSLSLCRHYLTRVLNPICVYNWFKRRLRRYDNNILSFVYL